MSSVLLPNILRRGIDSPFMEEARRRYRKGRFVNILIFRNSPVVYLSHYDKIATVP